MIEKDISFLSVLLVVKWLDSIYGFSKDWLTLLVNGEKDSNIH